MAEPDLKKTYWPAFALKYGCNPHQTPAAIYVEKGASLPFQVLNGTPGYINLLDALNGWQLVRELRSALGMPAATSFKHVSPAGAAVAEPLTPELREVYGVVKTELSPQATAYVRARGADPMSSFGDFAALSDPVDEATARVFRAEVSDGIIAPGYEGRALEILKEKKKGNFIVLQADPDFDPPEEEIKEVFGVMFLQKRNSELITPERLEKRVTAKKDLPPAAARDLLLALITVKYTQSNSVGYALDGQMIGIGAGQQSRVDCTKLAGRKVGTWFLRQHPKVLALPFKESTRRVDRVNAQVRYIEGDFTRPEYEVWRNLFENEPEPLEAGEKHAWMGGLKSVSLASDAFFPFRDSIDQAAQRGVEYLVQPGGSVADEKVIAACDEYGMVMAFSGVRLFHH